VHAAAAKMTMPTEHLTRKALECLPTWFGNARDRGAGWRKLVSKENTAPEDHILTAATRLKMPVNSVTERSLECAC